MIPEGFESQNSLKLSQKSKPFKNIEHKKRSQKDQFDLEREESDQVGFPIIDENSSRQESGGIDDLISENDFSDKNGHYMI